MKENAKKYYLDQDFNCAETVLRLANDRFALNIGEDDLKLVSGFGGGMGCEKTCGALCAGLAAISKAVVTGRAHATENFKEICSNYVSKFEETLGSISCAELREKYVTEEFRCIETVERSAELLESYLNELLSKESK